MASRLADQFEALATDLRNEREATLALRRQLRTALATLRSRLESQAPASLEADRPRRHLHLVVRRLEAADLECALAELGGKASAQELAAALARSGFAVGGQAVRWVAARAGLAIAEAPDGRRLYLAHSADASSAPLGTAASQAGVASA